MRAENSDLRCWMDCLCSLALTKVLRWGGGGLFIIYNSIEHLQCYLASSALYTMKYTVFNLIYSSRISRGIPEYISVNVCEMLHAEFVCFMIYLHTKLHIIKTKCNVFCMVTMSLCILWSIYLNKNYIFQSLSLWARIFGLYI